MAFRYRRALELVVVLALALRVGFALWYPSVLVSDRLDYHNLAVNLAQGRGYVSPGGAPEAYRAPGYPYFVGGVYWLLGPMQGGALVAQALLDVGTMLLLWWWARRRLGEGPALVAAAMWAFSMSAVGSVRNLYSECLASFLLTLALALVDLWWHRQDDSIQYPEQPRGSWKILAVAGVVLGLLTLVRALMVGLPLLLALLFFWSPRRVASLDSAMDGRSSGKRKWNALAPAALLVGCYALTLTPWLARNYNLLGRPMLTTQGGWLLWSYHKPRPGVNYGDGVWDATWRESTRLPASQVDSFFLRRTLQSIRQDPAPVLAYLPRKVSVYFVPLDWEFWGGRVFNPTYLLAVLAALCGLRSLWRSHPHTFLLTLAPMFYGLLMALPFFGSPRYRLPNEAPLCLAAAWGAVQVLEALRRRRPQPTVSNLASGKAN